MDDLISRQAAIYALKAKAVPLYKDPGCNDIWERDRTLDNAIDVIRGLPSADLGLDEWCTECKEYDQERHCCPRFNRVIKETLKEAENNQWIPVSERLPEKYGWYQVTLKDGRVSRLYYDYKGDRWIDNVRKHMFELYDIYSKSTHKRITEEKEDVYWDDWVVAWMPLPEPYKEADE